MVFLAVACREISPLSGLFSTQKGSNLHTDVSDLSQQTAQWALKKIKKIKWYVR